MQWVLDLLGGLLGDALRTHRAQHRRASVRRGAVVQVRCRLAVGNTRARRGRLVLSPVHVAWHARRGGEWHALHGAQDARAVATARAGAHDGTVVIRLVRPGAHLALHVFHEDAETLQELLPGLSPSSAHVAPPRPPGSRWWAVACLVLGLSWAGLAGTAALDTYPASATVIGNPGWATCTVEWVDPGGGAHQADSDCFGEAPGTAIDVLVPEDGSDEGVTTAAMLWVSGAAVGFLLATVGVLRLLVVRRRRRAYRDLLEATPQDGRPGSALDVERTAEAVRRATRRAWAVVALGAASFIAFGALVAVMIEADGTLRAEGVRAPGTVLSVTPDSRSSRGGARVEFAVDGRAQVQHVDLGGYADDYEAGDRVEVIHDQADAARLTIDDVPYDPPWSVLPFAITFVAAPTGTAAGAWMLWRKGRCLELLRSAPWQQVRVGVFHHGNSRLRFVVDGEETWRATAGSHWRTLNWEPRRRSGWGLPDEATPGVVTDQTAWWVSDGRSAVFSADQQAPLVLARRRRSPRPRGA